MPRAERRITVVLVPGDGEGRPTRSFALSYRRLRGLAVLLALATLLVALALASWAPAAVQAARVPLLRGRIARLEAENARVAELEQALTRLEQQYSQLRTMVGADRPAEAGGVPLPPLPFAGDDTAAAVPPDAWPLAERGFVTREHRAHTPGGTHPGIDIAVREGTPVRAAGAGTVTAAGEDEVYGRYVHLQHAGGYETHYGHASEVLVRVGDRVARGQTIARSGNTGTSTAPHLHFEIWKEGAPVDPATLLAPPDRNR